MKSDGKGRLWSWILAVPLAAVLLYYSLRGVDWSGVWHTISGARWSLVALAATFGCGTLFLRAVRWRILLNAEARLPLGLVFCASMSGYLGNSFLPARAGELVRTLIINSRSSLSRTYVLTTALSERLMDVIALVLWSSIILLGVTPKPRWMADVSRTTTVVAALGALTIAVLPHANNLCRAIVVRLPLPQKLRDGLSHLVDQVLLGMRAFHHVWRFLGFAALTLIIWLSDACASMICARGLGLHLTFPVAMLLITAMGLGSALPSTPGYVGIYQFVAVTVLVPFGFTKDAALAYILVAQAMSYFTVLLLGLPCVYALKRGGKS